MAEPLPDWIDAPEFRWSPERPFRVEPKSAKAPEEPEPPSFEPRFAEARETSPPEPAFEKTPANDDAAPEPATLPARAPDYRIARLVIGLTQGIGLLLQTGWHSPTGMVLLFAPLILLADLGRIPGKLLLPWTLLASIGLALLGTTNNTMPFAAIALFLFIAQAMITAWAKSGEPLAPYQIYHDSAWTLALQTLFCIGAGTLAFTASTAIAGLLHIAPLALSVPAATLAVAFASSVTPPPRLIVLGERILTLQLPLILLPAAALPLAALHWQPPAIFCPAVGFALLLCLNASYRDGSQRPRWRELLEFAGAFTLAPLAWVGLAAPKPPAPVTGPLILLGLYGLFYMAAALIGLGGGGWMKRIERANPGLALVALALLAAQATSL